MEKKLSKNARNRAKEKKFKHISSTRLDLDRRASSIESSESVSSAYIFDLKEQKRLARVTKDTVEAYERKHNYERLYRMKPNHELYLRRS
jgi:hypothetical protein